MPGELSFKQALMVAAVPALISAASAYFAMQADEAASNVKEAQAIRQARITERDLIQHEATTLDELAYLIPVADNRAWGNYYVCRKNGGTRFDCAKNQKQVIPESTPAVIARELDGGY